MSVEMEGLRVLGLGRGPALSLRFPGRGAYSFESGLLICSQPPLPSKCRHQHFSQNSCTLSSKLTQAWTCTLQHACAEHNGFSSQAPVITIKLSNYGCIHAAHTCLITTQVMTWWSWQDTPHSTKGFILLRAISVFFPGDTAYARINPITVNGIHEVVVSESKC